MRVSQFDRTAPSRLYSKAEAYTKHLPYYHELPKNISKSMVVREQAQNQKEDIDFVIKRSHFQLELYRKKENEDAMRRTLFEKKLASAAEKVAQNQKDIENKKVKAAELYEKHLKNTYQKYADDERKHRQSEKEESYKLRKELQQFYAKQSERKKSAEAKQVSVGTCYEDAVNKINNIHRQNVEYAQKAERQLDKELLKNSNLDYIVSKKRQSVSNINKSKQKVYDLSLSILSQREKGYIQKYGRNQDGSLSAFKHIDEKNAEQKKRLADFFKRRIEKWSQEKKRVDQKRSEVSPKCTSILERTNNSFFKQTVSSFRDTAKEWKTTVLKNKSSIRSRDEAKKDEIMDIHLDLRLKMGSSSKINDKMQSMRLQAKKLASEFL